VCAKNSGGGVRARYNKSTVCSEGGTQTWNDGERSRDHGSSGWGVVKRRIREVEGRNDERQVGEGEARGGRTHPRPRVLVLGATDLGHYRGRGDATLLALHNI
jgi:hypothetical protein